MRVLSATNSPSMKAGVHFAELGVLFNKNANYVNPEGQKISSEGIRYFEDKTVPADIKERIQSIPLVKKLAEDHDVFVNYRSTDFTKPKCNSTRIDILYADYSKKFATTYAVEGFANDAKAALDIAFEKICNLKANRAITGELSFFEKMVDKIKSFRF